MHKWFIQTICRKHNKYIYNVTDSCFSAYCLCCQTIGIGSICLKSLSTLEVSVPFFFSPCSLDIPSVSKLGCLAWRISHCLDLANAILMVRFPLFFCLLVFGKWIQGFNQTHIQPSFWRLICMDGVLFSQEVHCVGPSVYGISRQRWVHHLLHGCQIVTF